MEVEKKDREMKHLGFVRMAAIQALVCVSNLYSYGKQNSGPLRSTVGTAEAAVSAVVGPVYEKFKGVPDDLLVYLDQKVDEATHKFDKHAPPVAKQAVSQAHYLILKALERAQKIVKEYHTGGPRAAMNYAAAESRQIALTHAVNAWVKLNQYPSVHKVSGMVVLTVAHWLEKYNHVVKDMTRKGYAVFDYLPSIPIDEMAKAFGQGKAGKKEEVTEHKDSSSDSD